MSRDPSSVDAAASVGMLIDAWALMTGRFSNHRIEAAGGVATTFANRPLAFFNLSMLDRPLVEADAFRDALGVARTRASACRHSSFLALCGDWAPPSWEDLSAQAGWLRAMSLVGMAAQRLLPPRRPGPSLAFRPIGDPATALDLGLVNALAYEMPPETFDCVAEMALWNGASFGAVGYDDGRPVACAATFLVGEIIYVAMVACAPGLHGRGYGEATMRWAIDQAQLAIGPRPIRLHATAAGLPLYRSMGFVDGAELTLLQLAAPGAGA
jgi:GNAT superfamily N-acetyltransferase